MKIQAIQTGHCITKQSFRRNKGRGRAGRLLRLFLDRTWTEKLPYDNWLIEHPEGLILIDTGETVKALQPDYYPAFNRFFIRQNSKIFIRPEDEIGPRLEAAGIKPDEVRWVILTHMHQDHIGGLDYFPKAEILVSRREYEAAFAPRANLQGYMPHTWPAWFKPRLVDYENRPLGPFPQSFTLTKAGDVHLVPTAGHTLGHMAVMAKVNGTSFFFGGDAAFSQQVLIDRGIDGVASDARQSAQTLERINQYARQKPTVYLPNHDPTSKERLAMRQTVY
jgi:N-acyl homoserine lactone hydrolase